MKKIVNVIDSISEWVGRSVSWLCAAVVLIVSFEVTMRYLFNSPTVWAHETSIMIAATLYILGWAYTLKHRGHVRVDILYTLLSPRGKAIVDIAGTLIVLLPLFTVIILSCAHWTWRAWSTGEQMIYTAWFPPVAPIRTVILMGFCLFVLQGVANMIHDFYFVIRKRQL